MQNKGRTFLNWSGGKDSSFALWKHGIEKVDLLLCSVSSDTLRISMHGVRESLLEAQAASIGIPLEILYLPTMPDMASYEKAMNEKLESLAERGFERALFGDLFLEDLKKYRLSQYEKSSIQAGFPIWKYDTAELIREFVDAGFKAMLVAVDLDKLGEEFLGRVIDGNFLAELPEGVDPCGENGEYHTFVFDGPVFKSPLEIVKGEKIYRSYPDPADASKKKEFGFIDLMLK